MTGVGGLIRLILRRDRVLLPLWVVLLALVPLGYVTSFNGLFPTAADRRQYYDLSVHNAGFVALYGRLSGPDLGELISWRAGFLPVLIGLFSLLTVIRHTRTDEEAGRTELLGAAVVGRHAQLAAALIVTYAANLVLGLLLAAGLTGQGLPGAGSLAMGAEFTLAGWAFAAVAAVTAQLAAGARTARSLAVLVLGAAWVLRLGGDVSAIGTGALSWLSWLSPVGWVQHIYPYGADRWWPAVLTVLFSAAATGAAVVLLGRRDLGAGLIPPRPGPATAAPTLRSPYALAWRLHRGLLLAWTVGFAALGLVFGGVADSITGLTSDNAGLTEIFDRLGGGAAITDAYFSSAAGILGLIAAGYTVQAALRMRDEEATGHAEMVLTSSVSRLRWAAGHLVFAVLGPAVALAAAGLTEGLTHGDIPHRLTGTLAQLPAVWTLTALTVVLFAVVPRAAVAAWAALAGCVLILLVGQTLQLNQYLLDISPFTHVPHPGRAAPLLALTAVAVIAAAVGLLGFRRRDVPA